MALLAFDQAGEGASAAARATEILKRNGLTWEEALAAIPLASSFSSELVVIEPGPNDELSRLRAEPATSKAMREVLLAELESVRSFSAGSLF